MAAIALARCYIGSIFSFFSCSDLSENRMKNNCLLDLNCLNVTLDDICGLEEAKETLKTELFDLLHENTASKKLPLGILLHGPPGTGKTLLARAIAKTANIPFFEATIESLSDGYDCSPEQNAASLFSAARKLSPAIIFFDEADGFFNDHVPGGREGSLLSVFKRCWDGLDGNTHKVVVLGTTTSISNMHPAILRRFTVQIPFSLPDENERRAILKMYCEKKDCGCCCQISTNALLELLVLRTVKCSSSQIEIFCDVARRNCLQRYKKEEESAGHKEEKGEIGYRNTEEVNSKSKSKIISSLLLCLEDFPNIDVIRGTNLLSDLEQKISNDCLVSPTQFGVIVNFDSVGGLTQVKKILQEKLCGIQKLQPAIVLLNGPSGTGKTMIARSLAAAPNVTFLQLEDHVLKDGIYGVSEKLVAAVFSLASKKAPCIIFLDNASGVLDNPQNYSASLSLVPIFQRCLDNLDGGVLFLAATNNKCYMNQEILSKFEEIKFSLPNEDERKEIMKVHFQKRKCPCAENIIDFLATNTVDLLPKTLNEIIENLLLLQAAGECSPLEEQCREVLLKYNGVASSSSVATSSSSVQDNVSSVVQGNVSSVVQDNNFCSTVQDNSMSSHFHTAVNAMHHHHQINCFRNRLQRNVHSSNSNGSASNNRIPRYRPTRSVWSNSWFRLLVGVGVGLISTFFLSSNSRQKIFNFLLGDTLFYFASSYIAE